MAQMSRTEIYQQVLENEADLIQRMNNLSTEVNPMEQEIENDLLLPERPIAPPSHILSDLPPLGPLVRQDRVVNTGCSHTLIRGPRRGQYCNKRFHRDSEYCRNHYRRYISPITRPAVYEEKQNHEHLIYKSCAICNHKTEGPKVILECECEYHLNCFMMIQHEKNCFKCSDKIHKEEKDYPDCSICLEKVKLNKIKTRCGHIFHKYCVDAWYRIGRGVNTDKCPNCRSDL